MDTNELRSLQEAYLEVVEGQQLDEAMSSYDRNRKRAAQRAAERNAARAAGKTGVVPGVGYVSPRKERETYTDEKGTVRHKSGAKMEQVSVYDIVLSHLLDEGYADTVESAEGIMINMSEEWRDDIVEELTGERRKRAQEKIRELRPKGRRRKSTDAAVGAIDRVVRSKEGGKDPSKFPTKRGGYGEKGKMKSYRMGGGSDRGDGNKAARRAGKSVQDTRGDED